MTALEPQRSSHNGDHKAAARALPPAPAFQPQIEIRPEIHIPAPAPDDDTPDNVHQFQR